ncbi:MAG: acetylglutamate kinase [Candidatus Omnitrophota bacterium]|nr:acetylglutamate kinase [Candidatus Omnitrophota bacterium]
MKNAIRKSEVLIEALPHIKKFAGKVIVIKYGGAAVDEKGIENGILEDIIFMNYAGMRPILIHGGGPLISKRMKKAGLEPMFIQGRRVTDSRTVEILDKALHTINRKIVHAMRAMGAKAFGLSGRDNKLIKVKKLKLGPDLGFVGEVTSVDTTVVKRLIKDGMIPVIYPLGVGRDGNTYNVNADDVASGIAIALKAEKFALLTNVRGILKDKSDPKTLCNTLTVSEVQKLIKMKIIDAGMIPKALSCMKAIKGGVKKAHILDAGIPHALLLEIFTDRGVGTEIVK